MSEVQADIQSVVLDGAKLTYWTVAAKTGVRSVGASEGQWACMPDAQLAMRFEFKVVAEDSVGRGVTTLTLQKAADRSLIVRQHTTMRVITFGFIPDGYENVVWARFRQVDKGG